MNSPGPSPRTRELYTELAGLDRELSRILAEAEDALNLDQEVLQALERAEVPLLEERWTRADVENVVPTASLDELVEVALTQLLPLVDRDWLRAESANNYRFEITSRLHLVAGIRLRPANAPERPQRFASMLLVAQDHLAKRDDFDFFGAAMTVPELAMLGHSLDAIRELGPEAARTLAALPTADDSRVASMIHELLVGAAFIKRGRNVEMLPENKAVKVPDFVLRDMGAPMAIECKRRLGITTYEVAEARHVESLYAAIRELLTEKGLHIALEVVFTSRVAEVSPAGFRTDVERLLAAPDVDGATIMTVWGALHCEVLPYMLEFPRTRLYCPDYLHRVFGWEVVQRAWDGLLCEVDPPNTVIVSRARNPRCLKWVSLSSAALLKKARGLTSLWRDASAQFRAGEMGLVYIAYPEGGRELNADARTAWIQNEVQNWQPQRWAVRIPMSVIARLYPRSLGVGMPDLIESSFAITVDGDEAWLGMFPLNVFTISNRTSKVA